MNVDLQTLKDHRRKVAALVLRDPVFAPIFERLEREIAALEHTQDVIERARAIAANQSAVA